MDWKNLGKRTASRAGRIALRGVGSFAHGVGRGIVRSVDEAIWRDVGRDPILNSVYENMRGSIQQNVPIAAKAGGALLQRAFKRQPTAQPQQGATSTTSRPSRARTTGSSQSYQPSGSGPTTGQAPGSGLYNTRQRDYVKDSYERLKEHGKTLERISEKVSKSNIRQRSIGKRQIELLKDVKKNTSRVPDTIRSVGEKQRGILVKHSGLLREIRRSEDNTASGVKKVASSTLRTKTEVVKHTKILRTMEGTLGRLEKIIKKKDFGNGGDSGPKKRKKGKGRKGGSGSGSGGTGEKLDEQSKKLDEHTKILEKIEENTAAIVVEQKKEDLEEQQISEHKQFAAEESALESTQASEAVAEAKQARSVAEMITTAKKADVVGEGWGEWLKKKAIGLGEGALEIGGALKIGEFLGLGGAAAAGASTMSSFPGVAAAGIGAKKAGSSMLGKVGSVAAKGLGWGLAYGPNAYDAVAANKEHAEDYGVSRTLAGVTDTLYTLTAGIGDLLFNRKDTAQAFANVLGLDSTKPEDKLAANNREIINLKKELEKDPQSEKAKQQEQRIRDLKEENEKLLNKILKDRAKAGESEIAYNDEGVLNKVGKFLTHPISSIGSALGLSSSGPSSKANVSSQGEYGWKTSNGTPVGKGLSKEEKGWVEQYSKQYDVDPALVYALIGGESNNNSNAVSKTGVRGLMQVTKETARHYKLDRDIPQQQVEAGVRYLSDLLKQYNGDVNQALAEYNGGPKYAKRAKAGRNYTISPGKDAENDQHYRNIMKRYAKIKEQAQVEVAKKDLPKQSEASIVAQNSDQQILIKKFQSQSAQKDKEERKKDQMALNSVVAPSQTVINNNYNSSIVQSGLRHGESSLARGVGRAVDLT